METHPDRGWVEGIEEVVFSMNTSVARTTGVQPFEAVFAHKANVNERLLARLAEQDMLDEAVVDEHLIQHPDPSFNEQQDISILADVDQQDIAASDDSPVDSPVNSPVTVTMEEVVLGFGDQSTMPGVEPCSAIVPDVPSQPLLARLITPKNKRCRPASHNETPHQKVRRIALDNFVKSANRQQVNYDRQHGQFKDFEIGDNVGLRIDKTDRTNTSMKVVPCKVLEHTHGKIRVFNKHGIINVTFNKSDLSDLTNCFIEELENIDITKLTPIPLTTASRITSGWQTDVPMKKTICKCNGTCSTLKCPCKKAGVPCATKCHVGRACANKM